MVAPVVLGALLEFGKEIIGKFIPDPVEAAKATVELAQLDLTKYTKTIEADIASDLAQVEVNKIEASSEDKFKSWWRPAVGWVCVIGLGYQFLLRPFAILGLTLGGISLDWSVLDLDIASLMTLLGGILGLGWYRTQEKMRGSL